MGLGHSLALPLGGGPDDQDVEQEALLAALAPGLDPMDPAQIAQTYGEALAIAMVWALDRRLKGILNPHQMIETLPTWEEACGLRPLPTDTDTDRRNALAAQFLGYVSNTLDQLYQMCAAIAGAQFLGFYIPSSNAVTYTPGLMPGPPGWENMSLRAVLGVRLSPVATSDADFLDVVRRLFRQFNLVCPSWMLFVIGTDEGHAVVDVAVADRTLVMD